MRGAYLNGKTRGASQFAPTGATINGIAILGARDLTHDMLLLKLAVPSRVTEIKSDELMGTAGSAETAANKARGLLRRVENLYSGLPAHHQMLRGELDRDHAELDDMLANPPGPFEHAGALADKQAELSALTLELRLAAESRNGGFVRNLIEKARDHRNSRLDTDELDAMLAAHHVDASDEDLVRRFRVLLAEDFAEGLPVAVAEAERSRDEPPGGV